ncbi:unnamed protein product [Closterium sp. Yama58-4]|nr:unnamed protein product [Closterium sp. Yama58-4]
MPPKGKPCKVATNKMDPAAAALKTPATGSMARPALVTAVPSKSTRTLFAEEDSESLTLSAKLDALRIEQAAGGKADNGKGKDGDFKDVVFDAEEAAAEDVAGESSSGAARRFCILDDEDDGLIAHDPKECFEDKAKEELAAKPRFPLTLLFPSDHLQEVPAHTRPVKVIFNHKFGIRVVLQANLRLHMGPGIWRLPSANTAKPGVERVVRTVTERHRAGKSGNFGSLLTKLKAALRRYATEERKRVRATLRHLELAVSETKGEIASKVLSGKVKSKKMRTMIPALTVQGVEQKGTKGILEAASGFYAELFAEAPPSGLPCWKPDVGKMLRGDEAAELDADWSEEEIKAALGGMARDKSPGNDGLPKELFELHWDLLKEDFIGFFKRFEETAVLSEEVQEAVNILLHKKGPRELVKNYRPITLFTSSYKVVAKLLANRMKKVLGTVISEEQHGFLPGRRLTDAVSMVADVIEAANNDNEDWYLMMVDFQKAFDSGPEWRVVHVPPGQRMARVDVCKGVRQGCPLAPYLFLCAVEPFCQEAKRRKLGICDDHGDRLAYLGYADDTTLVLKGKQQIGRAETLLEEFKACSGFRVKKDKSAILPLGKNLDKGIDRESAFTWIEPKEAKRLLGVWVSPSGSAAVTWEKALARAAEELVKWRSQHLTTTARVAVVNTYVCPILAFQGQASECLSSGNLGSLKDPSMDAPAHAVLRVAQLALSCTVERTAACPSMAHVANELQAIREEWVGKEELSAAVKVDAEVQEMKDVVGVNSLDTELQMIEDNLGEG